MGDDHEEFTDFAAMCRWQQTAPESHFRKGRICTRMTDDGRITLSRSEETLNPLASWAATERIAESAQAHARSQ